VGFVSAQSASTASNGVGAFRDRLRELGYVQGQNLVIEARWAGSCDKQYVDLALEYFID
jgi:hypothetical protein